MIKELNGRVQWFWPDLYRRWAAKSKKPVEVVAEGPRVRIVGDWGLVRGVHVADFADHEMAVKAQGMVKEAIKGIITNHSSGQQKAAAA